MAPNQERAMNLARQIFSKGVSAVVPSNLIRTQAKLKGQILEIQSSRIDLSKYNRSFIVGFGKAVLPMAEEMLEIIGNKVDRCLLSVPEGTRTQNNSKIEVWKGARNNIPDDAAFNAAVKIVELAGACAEDDLLIVLISGGGSALLPYPKPPIKLEEKLNLIKKLSSSGASINELNLVRSKISVVKGGGLARLCPAKRIVSLILSDVLGDPISVIASGPTSCETISSNTGNASDVIKKYLKTSDIPPTIANALRQSNSDIQVTNLASRVENIILGNNQIALKAAKGEALKESLVSIVITSFLEGEARDIGEKLAILTHFTSRLLNGIDKREAEGVIRTTLEYLHSEAGDDLIQGVNNARDLKSGICLLLGGEPTVTVKGKGTGGRNQELALSAAITLDSLSTSGNITILSAGTDGIDGPCDAAGAIVNGSTCMFAKKENLNPATFLNNNDSYNFFKQVSEGQYHLITGHTGTNVMDLIVVLVYPNV